MRKRGKVGSALAALGAMALMAGCGGGGDDGDSKSASTSAPLTFVSYGGSYTDAEKEAWLDPFSEEFGIKIQVDGPPEPAKLKAQVDSGNVSWDVYESEPYFIEANCGTLFEELNLDTSHIETEYDFSKCGGPISLITNLLTYNTEQFGDNGPASYSDFFDTKAFPGKRGMVSFLPYGQLELALLADGVEPDALYPLDVERALAKLDTIRPDLVLWESGAQMQEQLESGSVAMGMAWNGRAYDAITNGANITPVWHQNLREGTLLAVPKGSSNLENAEKLIQWIMEPENQARLTELIPYGPTTSEAEPDVDPEAEKWLPNYGDNGETGVTIDMGWWAENYEAVSQRWTEWQAG